MTMRTEYVVFLLLGLLFGLAAYVAVGAAWLMNFAWQNVLAG